MMTMPADVEVLDGAIEPDRRQIDVGGGSLVAFTSRSPDKETENQDTVAIIPWGPQAAVLVVADGAGGLPAGATRAKGGRASLMVVDLMLSVPLPLLA